VLMTIRLLGTISMELVEQLQARNWGRVTALSRSGTSVKTHMYQPVIVKVTGLMPLEK